VTVNGIAHLARGRYRDDDDSPQAQSYRSTKTCADFQGPVKIDVAFMIDTPKGQDPDETNERGLQAIEARRVPLPVGYRQGVISAITVLLGFSLLFLRYWNFEADGGWTTASILATLLLALSIVLQLVALWRSLLPRDDDEPVYQVTLRWFLASIIALLAGVLLAGLIASHVFNF